MLADRIAAALLHHEPGWRLPRLTALARRYQVSVAEVETAVDALAARHLLRRLPDGHVYRASPAEWQVPLAGLAGLASHVDPMGGELTCPERQVSSRRVPEDAGRALGLAPGETVLVVRCRWLVGGEPGALSATYLPQRLAGMAGHVGASPLVPWQAVPGPRQVGTGETGLPGAVQVELGPPPPSVARSLRLAAGQPVATVTVRFEDPAVRKPVALTMAMLRPDLFRIVVRARDGQRDGLPDGLPDGQRPAEEADGFASAWTGAAEGWEP